MLALLAPANAAAQADLSPAPPNILLLVDTSGSMDYKTGADAFPACRYSGAVNTGASSERSRWIDLVEVLTGSIQNYDCQRLDRNSTDFRNEYKANFTAPYDALYANPYHRPASGGCVPGPGDQNLLNPAAFLPTAIKFHPFDNVAANCSSPFNQASDGILDAFLNEVRFGLMTFDTNPDPRTDQNGLWSYFVGASKLGRPQGCETDQAQEVGVRNPEAPPWEGRAVGFGNPALGSIDYKSRNAMIQQILLATRPYGATPIAGMLDDAEAYFLADTRVDPLDSSFSFGPAGTGADPAKDCRTQAIVLLSDGQPNMDLRPYCEPAHCPYDRPEDIAENLKSNEIPTYVIGFALSSVVVNGVSRECSSFQDSDFDEGNPSGICASNPNDAAIQACCALNRIAAAGGPTPLGPKETDWRRARFADNRDELRAALSNAIGRNLKTTTRTPNVNASGAGFVGPQADLDFARSFRFAAGFKPGLLETPWTGELNRARWVCEPDDDGKNVPVLRAPDPDDGDYFVDNVNASGPDARNLYTVIGASPVNSNATIRPNLPLGAVDGAGTYSGTMNAVAHNADNFVSGTSAAAIGVDDSTCDTSTQDLDANQCRDHYLKWLVGKSNGTVNHRCPNASSGDCSLIGDIYHSVPRAVPGVPSAYLNDESYTAFVEEQTSALRPSVLYVSTNDGFLHAFKIAAVTKNAGEVMKVKTKENNELWAFAPPGVLTGLRTQYPASHQLLLDGTPVVKDVVATEDNTLPTYKYRLERTAADAQAGTGRWRTILVQSFGAARPGYFAVDVTEPVPSNDGLKGPKFLWQLTTAEDGTTPLFGSGGATPLITTVFIDNKEVAVAVLPGGYGSAGTDNGAGGGCDRATSDYGSFTTDFMPRKFVPCYTGSAVGARSLTVVRLDSGEILRTFRRDAGELPVALEDVVTEAPLDSPLTGQPVAFPSDVGAVADRVFIGDQDGAIWRLNFASGDPDEWQMELFFDGFPGPLSHDWNDGQPIATPPIISVSQVGHLTVAFSTGDQEAIGFAPGLTNYVWSLTETPNADRTKLEPVQNWYLRLAGGDFDGDRVIGPMALFNGELFFSTVGPAPSADPCSSGSGKVWGMHYLEVHADGPGKGGRLSQSLGDLIGDDGYVDASTLLGSNPRAFLAGATVAQQPSCENPGSPLDDQYLSYGTHQSLGELTTGRFELIIPTGDQMSQATNARVTPQNYGGVNVVAVELASPPVANRIDSWAAIVD